MVVHLPDDHLGTAPLVLARELQAGDQRLGEQRHGPPHLGLADRAPR